jgi:Flp pilus assembly protein TadG
MLLARFFRDREGGVAPLLALSIVPIIGMVGAGIDYSRASATRVALQAALDSALLYAAKESSENWQDVTTDAFNAVVSVKNDATLVQPTYSVDADGNYVAQVAADVPTKISGVMGFTNIHVTVSATVKPGGDSDNSCILTLDKGAALSNVSMLFGGAPNIQLSGCSTRSNTSLNCNGHSSNADISIAAGSASGCSNPKAYVKQLPDIYEPLASNITKLCGGLSSGVTWTPGTVPSAVKQVTVGSYKEYHVCGTLTVTGTGYLTGSAPSSDSIIVIENGGLAIANGATISTLRTTIVLTGSANTNSNIDFPQGNGQSATLSLSPSISADNPWKGIALYQDPIMQTGNIDNDWGPGATFTTDGIVYLPYSDVETQGVAGSGNYKCTKIVSKSFTTKGSVNLNFSQVKAGCEAISMNQWADIPIHIVN